MLIETAVVTQYHNGIAKVRCETKKGCGGCAAQASCGAAALSELNGSRNQGALLFDIAVEQPLQTGQLIEIGLQEKSMILSALLLYIVPLTALLLSTLIGSLYLDNELLLAAFIFLMTAAAFVAIKKVAAKLSRRQLYQPVFLRKL
ncbi:positive regulator of sigma(E), RseC/MucC [Pasteurella testudinis DSM 23072]|uniref:Positive regulator of sigma(E), RseC/MucC n=1 Tax=Pasteurella testudinis DSM 23072 TaxID=1122938 RepID=A0A1W1UFB8_9PAST|nr:SoxR reducing system RseC family protein [Pasteurella testudinis]SMB79798.1 positive regulator of sigma(E), RseC/MucC [Pasteurella testudinis DSM 23072]SUB50667.1 putative regulator of sigma(E), RseC/MucC family [Pasteurella testudinis]